MRMIINNIKITNTIRAKTILWKTKKTILQVVLKIK